MDRTTVGTLLVRDVASQSTTARSTELCAHGDAELLRHNLRLRLFKQHTARWRRPSTKISVWNGIDGKT